MNSFTHVKSELKLLLSAALVFILASCTYSEPQTSINFSAFLPSSQQLGLKVTDIPSALSVYHHYPNAVDKEKARQLLKDRKVPDFTSYIQGATGAIIPVASQNHDRFSPTADMTNEQLLDAFDPFYIGAGNVAQNATTSGCGGTRSGEPNITFQYGNSWCLMGVIKFALHNAVTNYDNFHNILTSIIENLSTGNDIKGVESLYTNPSVQTLHASGLSIAVFFDDCVNHRDAVVADPEGLAMCTGEGDNAVYHRVKIYPLIPTSTSVTVDSVIGKMEWIQRPNSSVKAKMAISVSLMSPGDPAANGANPGFAGSQHQFELETDAEGKFQSIIIKKETRIICCTSFSVDHQWDANVVRITRLPGAGGNPGLWAVEGSILYNLEMGFNPLSPLVYEFQFGAHQPDKRVYFAGVTEDVFTGGRSVHKAIMADAGGGGLLDFNLYTPDQWDSELHLWAAYKKLLKMNFSKQHYEIAHGMNEPPINLWDAATGAQYLPSGTRTTQEQKSIELSPDGQTILVSSRNGLSLYTATENMYGNRNISLIGSCDPFPETTIQTNAKFNPNPSYPNQVLVADATYYAAVENTHEARMVDISDIANGNCPTIRSFFHPDSGTTGQGLYRVDFSPDGSKLMVEAIWDGKFKVWNTLDNTAPIAQITPSNFSTFSARFDSTGNRLISSHYDQSTYIMDIATGSVLKLHDDIGTPISSSHIEYAALENPNFPNQIISTRNGLLSYNIPGKIFRWDISAWDPLQGNATYSASISPYLLQDISASDVNGTLANVSGGNIDSSGSRLVIDSNVNSTVYAINISTGAIEAPITTLTPQRPYRPRTSYGNLFSPIFSQDGSQLYHLLRVNYNSCYGCTYDLQDHIVLQNVSAGAPPAPFKDGHVGRATMAVFSADGGSILSAGVDGNAILWNLFDASVQQKFVGHTDAVPRALFSHNGTRIATASADMTVRIWDAVKASPTFGTTLATYTGNTAAVSYIDYDSNFGHRYATSSTDGSVRIFNDAGTTLATFANLFAGGTANWLDFSDDGTLLVVGGSGTTNHIVILDTDPTTSYGAYNNLGSFTVHTNSINSAMFYPDGTGAIRLLTAGTDARTKVSIVTPTPNGILPPTVSLTEEKSITITSTQSVITNQLEGLIVGPLRSGSGCYGCPRIYHYDLNPANVDTYGLRYSTSVAPIGADSYHDTTGQIQEWFLIYSGNASPDGSLIVGAGPGSLYQDSWTDFDGYWDRSRDSLFDERDGVNPYFTEPSPPTTAGCYILDITALNSGTISCTISCAEVGGCTGYAITSNIVYERAGTNPPAQYNRLLNKLNQRAQDYPDTAGYFVDQYVFQPIN